MAEDALQKVGDIASEINRLANSDKKEDKLDEIRDLVEKMDDKVPE